MGDSLILSLDSTPITSMAADNYIVKCKKLLDRFCRAETGLGHTRAFQFKALSSSGFAKLDLESVVLLNFAIKPCAR